jgi:ribosome-binding protein aMBF1 (putative translation factor)
MSHDRQPTFLANSWPALKPRPSSPTDELMRSLGHTQMKKGTQYTERTAAFAHQDWSKTTIKNPLMAKAAAQPAPRVTTTQAVASKLADSEIAGKLKQLAPASRQEIVNRRVANKWSQADLNAQCCFPANTIREIEAGRVPPTIGQLNKLNQVLKTGLKFA